MPVVEALFKCHGRYQRPCDTSGLLGLFSSTGLLGNLFSGSRTAVVKIVESMVSLMVNSLEATLHADVLSSAV